MCVDDLFGSTLQLAGGGTSQAGRPRLPVRLMVSLILLKHTYNKSDESVVERWAHDVCFQYFSGLEYLKPKSRAIPRRLAVLGKRLVKRVEKNPGTHGQRGGGSGGHKAEGIGNGDRCHYSAGEGDCLSSDSRLLEIARITLIRQAKQVGLKLKQTFQKEGKELRFKASGFGRAKQFKRLKRVVKSQKTVVVKLIR